MNENVIELFPRSPEMVDGPMSFIGCRTCLNKTFVVMDTGGEDDMPLLKCAACGAHIGRMGWCPELDDGE